MRVYRYNGVDRWEQLGSILEGDPSDEFGYDVKINYIGDIILVGCPGNNKVVGFKYNGNSWVQLGNEILNEKSYTRFGSTIDINGEGIVVVVGTSNTTEGIIQTYEYNGTKWRLLGNIAKANQLEKFGNVLAISAEKNTIIVGVSGADESPDMLKLYNYYSAYNSWINTNTISLNGKIKSATITGDGQLMVVQFSTGSGINAKDEIQVYNLGGKLMTLNWRTNAVIV